MSSGVDEAIERLSTIAATATNGLPELREAAETLRSASGAKAEKDAHLLEHCVTSTLCHTKNLLVIAGSSIDGVAPETLLRDLPGLRRGDMINLLIRGLEPPLSGVTLLLSAIKGPLPPPHVRNAKRLAEELIDGMSLAAVQRFWG